MRGRPSLRTCLVCAEWRAAGKGGILGPEGEGALGCVAIVLSLKRSDLILWAKPFSGLPPAFLSIVCILKVSIQCNWTMAWRSGRQSWTRIYCWSCYQVCCHLSLLRPLLIFLRWFRLVVEPHDRCLGFGPPLVSWTLLFSLFWGHWLAPSRLRASSSVFVWHRAFLTNFSLATRSLFLSVLE